MTTPALRVGAQLVQYERNPQQDSAWAFSVSSPAHQFAASDRRRRSTWAHAKRAPRVATAQWFVKIVAMTSYAVAHLADIDELDDGREPFRPVRHHFGITSFGVTAWTARAAGDRIINEHDESEPDASEELYLVTQGRAVFELDGDRIPAPTGTFVFAPPGVKRTAFADEPDTTIVAIGGAPGRVYEPDGWEVWAPLNPLYEAGDYAGAADRGRELLKAYPQYPGLFYNVACCESLAGRTADAIEHLARAIDHSELSRSFAREDSDFDPIRDEPAFRELMGRA